MSFQTNTFVNGQWVTQTVDMHRVLEQHQKLDQSAKMSDDAKPDQPPACGILTQTVIETPLIHWILPCRLRKKGRNDVAFIGDHVIQIRELQADNHLRDVVRKSDFGSRICNARVINTTPTVDGVYDVLQGTDEEHHYRSMQSSIDDDSAPSPQCLVLALEDGDLIFLHCQESEDGVRFVSARHQLAKSFLLEKTGRHLAVDPSSRYVAVAKSQTNYVIMELNTASQMREQSKFGQPVKPIRYERYFKIDGIIHKMEFLYPAPDDPNHIILLLIVIRNKQSRMVVLDWDHANGGVDTIRTSGKYGYPFTEPSSTPLLLIPLTIRSAFLLASDEVIAVYKNILAGPPEYEVIDIRTEPPTELHHGINPPMWTAWSRPHRLGHYTPDHDDIYLVREDGVVRFLETTGDGDDLNVTGEMDCGNLQCNVGTAFANLEQYPSSSSDLLVAAGESCVGGLYRVEARSPTAFIEPIMNWSPTPDFTVVPNGDVITRPLTAEMTTSESPSRVDRIFACTGKGNRGAITELRHGVDGRICLDMDFDIPIANCWSLSYHVDEDPHRRGQVPMIFLINADNRSALYYLSGDASELKELGSGHTCLDLTSRTIIVRSVNGFTVQITEKSVVVACTTIINPEPFRFKRTPLAEKATAAAFVSDRMMVIATRGELSLVSADESLATVGNPVSMEGEVRCMSAFEIDNVAFVVCGVSRDDQSSCLVVYRIDVETGVEYVAAYAIPQTEQASNHFLEAIWGVSTLQSASESGALVLAGLRNGFLVCLSLNHHDGFWHFSKNSQWRLGGTHVAVSKDSISKAFVYCNSAVYVASLTGRSDSETFSLKLDRVWLTDAAQPAMAQPDEGITSAFRTAEGEVVITSGTHLLVVDMDHRARTVPRRLNIDGEPSKIIYSEGLGVLVIAALKRGVPTLLFMDPSTGADLSHPLDKTHNPVDYVSGLGKTGDKITALVEWQPFKSRNPSKARNYIIVGTQGGRLLIIETEQDKSRGKVGYWTKHKVILNKPVHAAIACEKGLFYCAGNSLCWEILDTVSKRFKKQGETELLSPAVSISVEADMVYIATARNSLFGLKLHAEEPRIRQVFSDNAARVSFDQIRVNDQLRLLSDIDGAVPGLWYSPAQQFEPVAKGVAHRIFEADTRVAILRFCKARTRPTWDVSWNAQSGEDGKLRKLGQEEILGIAMDGSVRAFTVLEEGLWRLLGWLNELMRKSRRYCPFTWDWRPVLTTGIWVRDGDAAGAERGGGGVDGDLLRRVVEDRGLEELLGVTYWGAGEWDGEGAGDLSRRARECERRLGELMAGVKMEIPGEASGEGVDDVQRLYALLEYLLRPVI